MQDNTRKRGNSGLRVKLAHRKKQYDFLENCIFYTKEADKTKAKVKWNITHTPSLPPQKRNNNNNLQVSRYLLENPVDHDAIPLLERFQFISMICSFPPQIKFIFFVLGTLAPEPLAFSVFVVASFILSSKMETWDSSCFCLRPDSPFTKKSSTYRLPNINVFL